MHTSASCVRAHQGICNSQAAGSNSNTNLLLFQKYVFSPLSKDLNSIAQQMLQKQVLRLPPCPALFFFCFPYTKFSFFFRSPAILARVDLMLRSGRRGLGFLWQTSRPAQATRCACLMAWPLPTFPSLAEIPLALSTKPLLSVQSSLAGSAHS